MIFRNVNLYDPTCMQNIEVTTQVAYALIWTIFKRDLNFTLKQGLHGRTTVDAARIYCRYTVDNTVMLMMPQLCCYLFYFKNIPLPYLNCY
jgi:hypothetical protein